MWKRLMSVALLAGASAFAGCSGGDQEAKEPAVAKAELPAGLLLQSEPTGAVDLLAAKKAAKLGDEITFKCRIGGRAQPFADASAVMVVIDPSLKPCPPEEGCPRPWDYCCDPPDVLTASTASVRIVGADGKVLKGSLLDNNGLTHLSKLTVTGKVIGVDGGILQVDATGIYIRG